MKSQRGSPIPTLLCCLMSSFSSASSPPPPKWSIYRNLQKLPSPFPKSIRGEQEAAHTRLLINF